MGGTQEWKEVDCPRHIRRREIGVPAGSQMQGVAYRQRVRAATRSESSQDLGPIGVMLLGLLRC